MVLSASSVVALDDYGSSWYVVMRQAHVAGRSAPLACVVMLRVDYHRWRRLAAPALVRQRGAPGPRARAGRRRRGQRRLPVARLRARCRSSRRSWPSSPCSSSSPTSSLAAPRGWTTPASRSCPSRSCSARSRVLRDAAAEPRHHARARRHRALAALGRRHAVHPAHRPRRGRRDRSPPGWPCGRPTGAPACSPSSTRGPTTRTAATRTSSRSWASRRAASPASASARAGPSGGSCPRPTPTSSSPSSARSSA